MPERGPAVIALSTATEPDPETVWKRSPIYAWRMTMELVDEEGIQTNPAVWLDLVERSIKMLEGSAETFFMSQEQGHDRWDLFPVLLAELGFCYDLLEGFNVP